MTRCVRMDGPPPAADGPPRAAESFLFILTTPAAAGRSRSSSSSASSSSSRPEPAFVRAVELYQAGVADRAIDVYFLCYAASVEEQNYTTAIARETDAFKQLIEATALLLLFARAVGTVTRERRHRRPTTARALWRAPGNDDGYARERLIGHTMRELEPDVPDIEP